MIRSIASYQSRALTALALLMSSSVVFAADTAKQTRSGKEGPDKPASDIAEGSEIVVTATKVNEIAPVTASLDARQPQAIVSRSLIENALPATSDFNQIALITPSVSNFNGNNGVGLSESKAQIRGFQDGEYNVTYDGVPFADTNDPTHHSTTFFPSNTIETLVVDRGPGNASQLGQATFGGNINLFSRATRDKFGGQLKASYGSFNTYLGRALINTGKLGANGPEFLFTGQYVKTDGRLSNSPYRNYNLFGKMQWDITPDVRFSLLGTYNKNRFNQPDNDGATLFQVSLFGKDFSLNRDPATPQFQDYNRTTKTTDFEIAHLDAAITSRLSFDDKAYTYYYDNETLSAADVTGATANLVTLVSGSSTKLFGIPGYTKTNKYRVYGNIAKFKLDLGFAALTAGLWYESNKTYRQQRDYDLVSGAPNFVEKVALDPVTGIATPRFIRFDQDSKGHQLQEFVELELRLLPGLTVTPGYKHVSFTREINALYNQGTRYPQNVRNTYTADLPFVQLNYAINPRLSIYGEYARGFLAPPLSQLYVANPSLSVAAPQRSTNYQAGLVYHGERLSFDADVYSIEFTNKFVATGSGATAGFTNIGGALYQGVEGQVTFAVTKNIALFANGSRNRATDNTTDLQIFNAPLSTAAGGAIVRVGAFRFSLIDKFTGPQYVKVVSSALVPNNGGRRRIAPYNTAILAASYEIGSFKIGAEVTDLFDSKRITNIKNSSSTNPASVGLPLADNFDQYYFQPGRQATLDLTYRF